MYLKDKVQHAGGFQKGNGGFNGTRRKLCFDYNRGQCTFGKRCKFDHRCSFCNKFGHGAHICQKANKTNNLNATNSTNQQPEMNVSANGGNQWEKYEKHQQFNKNIGDNSKNATGNFL